MPPVSLWSCPNDDLDPALARILATHWLDEHEKQTADAFLHERDRRQYLVAHTLVRRALALESGIAEAELVIRRSPRGRPCLQPPAGPPLREGAGVDFNLSHTGGYNLLGIVRGGRIGVDIERLDRGERSLEAIVETFTPREQRWVASERRGERRGRRAIRLWTLKEAYAKARGLGLGLPFETFSFDLAPGRGVERFHPPADDRPGRWRFIELEPFPDALAAVAVHDDARGTALHLHHGFPWSRASPHRIALPEPITEPPGPGRAQG